jgi:hypothetical protein
MSTFAPATAPPVTPLDPAKHVNFTRGMVLGVDDFDQEFAYLSGRDRWMVRDLIGYGVVSGLRLFVDPPPAGEEERGARIGVSGGVAALPGGQLVCVSPAQCAFVGEWIESKRAELDSASPPAGAGSPPAPVRAAVVLCYADCETDPVPIPGEPCRDEKDLMAPSRIRDHFSLELRLEPPAQLEEEAIRRFAAWLARVPVADSGLEPHEFADELRAAGSEDAGSPPSTAEFFDEPPAEHVVIPAGRVPDYLRLAFEIWTSELRSRWRMPVPGCECEAGPGCPPAEDCLLLGEVEIPVVWDAVAGELVLGDADDIQIDTSRRSTLLHLRMLQELLLAHRGGGGPRAAVVRLDTSPPEVSGDDIEVEQVDERVFHLIPESFDETATYAVAGTGIAAVASASPLVLELLDPYDPDLAALLAGAGVTEPGLTVRVQTVDGDPPTRGFSVTLERIGAGS